MVGAEGTVLVGRGLARSGLVSKVVVQNEAGEVVGDQSMTFQAMAGPTEGI